MPLPIDPLTIGAAAQGLVGLGKSIFGASQASKARRRLKQLEKERPKGYIPSAILELANEPIAEEFMQQQEDSAARRTSEGVGALSQGGSRTLLGGLPSLMDAERQGQMQRTGMYEQARRDALGAKGAAQERIRQEERQDFLRQVAAQTEQMGAGTQNIFTGLEDIGEGALFAGMSDDVKGLFGKKDGGSVVVDETSITADPRGSMLFQGGVSGFGQNLPDEVDDAFLKANPLLMGQYYKDPITGKFKRR